MSAGVRRRVRQSFLIGAGALGVFLLVLGSQASLGLPIWVCLAPLAVLFLVGIYVILEKVPLASLPKAEVGTSGCLALAGGVLSGLAAILALSIFEVSGGSAEDLANLIRGAAKGRVLSVDAVVFLSVFALALLWIALLRGRRFVQAREEALAKARAHAPAPVTPELREPADVEEEGSSQPPSRRA